MNEPTLDERSRMAAAAEEVFDNFRANADITLYNKSTGRTVSYTRTQISGVLWQSVKAVAGEVQANAASILIPTAHGSFSFRVGDVIVKGLVSDEITAGFTVSDLMRKYECVVVTSVEQVDSLSLPHWKVGAK